MTYVGFRVHVKIASRIVSYRIYHIVYVVSHRTNDVFRRNFLSQWLRTKFQKEVTLFLEITDFCNAVWVAG